MPSILLVRPPVLPDSPDWTWLLLSGQTEARGGGETLAAAWERAQADDEAAQSALLVPDCHLLLLACTVPGRRSTQMRQALPYVVEEHVVSDIDTLHIATGTIKPGMPVRCCVIDRESLAGWLDDLASLGINPGCAVPESELLPEAADTSQLLLTSSRALLRTGTEVASVERANLAHVLPTLSTEAVQVLHGHLTDLEAAQLSSIQVTPSEASTGDELSYLAGCWPPREDAINLLQGAFRSTQKRQGNWRAWRLAASLALVWGLAAVLNEAVEGWWSGRQAKILEDSVLTSYQALFPNEVGASAQNVRRRLAQKLPGQSVSERLSLTGFLGHLAAVVQPGTRLLGIDYSLARGECHASLLVRGYDEVEQMREALANRGLDAETVSAEQVEDGVRARIRIAT